MFSVKVIRYTINQVLSTLYTQKYACLTLFFKFALPIGRGEKIRTKVNGKDQAFVLTLYQSPLFFSLFKRFYLFIFRERGREGEREGEKHQCVVASWAPPPGDLACNPGMCPDRESNWPPFGSQAGIQSTEPHQPGQKSPLYLSAWNATPQNALSFLFAFILYLWAGEKTDEIIHSSTKCSTIYDSLTLRTLSISTLLRSFIHSVSIQTWISRDSFKFSKTNSKISKNQVFPQYLPKLCAP